MTKSAIWWGVLALTLASAAPVASQAPDTTSRQVAIIIVEAVVQSTDSLAQLAAAEKLERAGCLLGGAISRETVDSVFIVAFLEAEYTSRARSGADFICPRFITIGHWHSHPPPRYEAVETACDLSDTDIESAKRAVNENYVSLQMITVLPGIKCMWFASPDTVAQLRWNPPQ